MAITDAQKEQLNRMCPTARNVKLGDELQAIVGEVVAYQADSAASTIAGLVVDFNALLAKLKAAGIMAAE